MNKTPTPPTRLRENLVRLNMNPVLCRHAGGDHGPHVAAAPGDNAVVTAAAGVVDLAAMSTIFGHFTVYNTWAEISSWLEGDFLERIAPGTFDRTFVDRAGQIRVLYDHGGDPSIGNKPLGTPDVLREEKIGPYFEVGLFDIGYVNQLKPALAAGQMGVSFRFTVTAESWVDPAEPTDWNPAKLSERTITEVELYEFGPVTFPAYAEATVGLRSRTDEFASRLAKDPVSLARFLDRVGPKHTAQVLTTVAASGPSVVEQPPAASGPGVAERGRLVASARTAIIKLTRR